jgi:hypothetical protein
VQRRLHWRTTTVLLLAGTVAEIYLLFAIKVIRQWEKVALLRLGK